LRSFLLCVARLGCAQDFWKSRQTWEGITSRSPQSSQKSRQTPGLGRNGTGGTPPPKHSRSAIDKISSSARRGW
jgi:hypothetical protein